MIQSKTANALLNQLAARYRLSEPARGRFRFARDVQVVAAAGNALSFYALDEPTTRTARIRLPVGEIQSLHVAHTQGGSLVACVSDDGRFCLWRPEREPIVTAVAGTKLGHITSCIWQRRFYFLVCAADQTIHLLDYRGQPVCRFDTPGRVLSLAVWPADGQTLLAGGVQDRPEVYVWDLPRILQRRDAAPIACLDGGQKPAYAALFAEIQGETWLLHGSWDGLVYGYRWPLVMRKQGCQPTPLFQATAPVYGLETVKMDGRAYLLVGIETEEVMVWTLDTIRERQPPLNVIPCGRGRVRWVKTAEIAGHPYLIAGTKEGKLFIWQGPSIEMLTPVTTLRVERDEVTGIGFLQFCTTHIPG